MDDIRARLEQALSGAYTFERELGGGGMSRTYLARETALNRQVVVKVLAPELLAGISVERFRREVLLAAQLQHPHVVPVLTSGEVDGIPWFTMPYVDGDSLRQRLAKGGVGIGQAVSMLRDVARALAYAHARGVVHRDIKPDNVLLSAGTATVTDFGIAKAISAARTDGGVDNATLTQVGTSIGTPAYMAPEQAAGDPDTDHRADLYAFGVMAYEVLAGRTPFVASTPTKLLAAHMSEAPRNILELRADCPPGLAHLVMRCLEKEPARRPADSAELVQVLETVTSSGSGAAMPEILRGGPIRLGRALALWAVATVLVIITAWAAREVIGLPDWVLPGAVGVMLAGLPVLAFTTYVQRTAHRTYTATPSRTPAPQGTLATLAMRASPHVSWRRTWLGGAIAVGSFAVLVVGFMVMRALGMGPMASLKGTGAFGARETLMIADFGSPPSDSTLGTTVAEALRTDLAQSTSLNVLTRSSIREALTLMQRSPEEAVPYELAREIATREGAKAVLDGNISQLGQSYVITARLASALDGSDLAAFREEAATEGDLLPALGRLSKEIRAKAGESLKSIRASNELERVTTPSLTALRKYVEGSRLADEEGEIERGMALIREAVQLDTAFAMAWRKLAVLLNNEGRDRAGMLDAISTAYRHRDRLTEMERLLTEGFYFTRGPTPDRDKALAAYEDAAKLDSLSTSALNNAAVILGEKADYEAAEQLYRRVVQLPHTFGGAFTNLLQEQIRNDRTAASLDSTVAAFRASFPESNDLWEAEWFAAWGKDDLAAADSIARAISAAPRSVRQAIRSAGGLSGTAELHGQVAAAAEWQRRSSEALYKVQPTPGNLLSIALDTVYYEMFYGTRATALAALARARARVPMAEIPPSERPWGFLKFVGAVLQEPELVREATAGFERDQAGLSSDPEGRRADYATNLAFAEERWRDVLRHAEEAERRYAFTPRTAALVKGRAYRELGQPDSAIAAFERFLVLRDPLPGTDATWRPRVLEWLGEAHEAKGNRAKAIEAYSAFTELWKDADPALQPKVREIRDRIARLQAETG
ncbi:MAG: protein kinase [Gemmatimonadetes bacterium]|nr:protein kinase [Gemmatimonadota bacterium]MCB9505180.1 protein kinase [Gemmatimonadales bacterium]